jgi:hypothetical protein
MAVYGVVATCRGIARATKVSIRSNAVRDGYDCGGERYVEYSTWKISSKCWYGNFYLDEFKNSCERHGAGSSMSKRCDWESFKRRSRRWKCGDKTHRTHG